MNQKRILWIFCMILLVQITIALKPATPSFFGYITLDGEYAPVGTLIEVFDSDLVLCGSFSVKQEGRYGLLSCTGDDPVTEEDEGAKHGDSLVFYVNDYKAITKENVVWQSGVLHELNLYIGEISEIQPILESPSDITYEKTRNTLIKIISLIGSIVLIILFLWFYNRK